MAAKEPTKTKAASKAAKNVMKRGASEAEAKKTAEKFAKNVKGKK